MEFTVSRNTLLRALQHTRSIIVKGEYNVFKNFVITFPDNPDENTMTVHTSNGSIWLSETVLLDKPVTATGGFAAGEKPHPISVWYSDFIRSIKSLDEQPLRFTIGELQMTVNHSCGSFRLPLSNQADEFLQIRRPSPDAEAPDGYRFEYEAPVLSSILNRCNFAMAKDELRPAMNGVYMNLTEEYSDYVSSDGHKLVRVRKAPVKCGDKIIPLSLILPSPVVKSLLRILPPTGDVVFEYQKELVKEKTRTDIHGHREKYSEQVRPPMVRIVIDDTITMSFCPIDGKYPAYWSVIPNYSRFQTTVERKKLIKSLDRLVLFQPTSGLVEMNVSDNTLRLNSTDSDFEMSGEEILPCTNANTTELINGIPFLRIGMKGVSLSQPLKALSSENVVFKFIDSSRAIIVQPVPQPDVEDITILLMPMLCND